MQMSERDTSQPGDPHGSRYGQGSASSHPAPQGTGPATETTPQYSTRPVAFRGPESLGGLLLLLAGIAAAISLPLHWVAGSGVTGWGLLTLGFRHVGDIFRSGLWQPMAIILGGGVLFLLGVLMWLPARTHRLLGLLALVVSIAAAAAVLIPLADAGWHFDAFGLGFWFGIAVPVLGLLGALKAMLTGPKLGTR
jgi:hypothetical protein